MNPTTILTTLCVWRPCPCCGLDHEIELEVEARYTRAVREVRYLRNGDPGDPGCPAEVDVDSLTVAATGEKWTGTLDDADIEHLIEQAEQEAEDARDEADERRADDRDEDERSHGWDDGDGAP